MNDYDALDRAVTSTGIVVKGIGPGRLGDSTPCADWSVRDLLNHLVGTLWLADDLFADREPQHGVVPGGLPESDLLGGDPSAAYAKAAGAAMASAALDGALSAPHATPAGEMPGAALAAFTALDLFVHGWDLARATDQSTSDLDPELAEHVLAFARFAFAEPARRSTVIGAEIPVSDDAPVVDRLVAYLGRQP